MSNVSVSMLSKDLIKTAHSTTFLVRLKIPRERHPLEGRISKLWEDYDGATFNFLLVALPDGSRTLVPAQWTDWKPANNADGPLTPPDDDRERHIAPLGDLLRLRTIVNALLNRESMSRPEPIVDEEGGHATATEVSELELLPAPPQITDENVGEAKEIRDAAVEILARIIAQAAKTNEQTMEACDG